MKKSKRYYNRPVKRRIWGWIGVAAAVVLAVVVVSRMYVPGMVMVCEMIGGIF